MIHVHDLHKSFGEPSRPAHVLRGLNLDVARGEFVALVGRSGSGKSTLLNLLAGLDISDAGVVRVDGVDLATLDDASRTRFRRDRVGIVFQFFNLLPVLSVLDNVALPGHLAGRSRAEVERRAAGLLETVGLADRLEAFPDELSGGEQQRVATARALVNAPALVLADEPTGNLDSASAETTLDLLRGVVAAEGRTVLLVTHDPAAAARADRTLRLLEGRIVDFEPAEQADAAAAFAIEGPPQSAGG